MLTCPSAKLLLILFAGSVAGSGIFESDETKRTSFVLHFVERKLKRKIAFRVMYGIGNGDGNVNDDTN